MSYYSCNIKYTEKYKIRNREIKSTLEVMLRRNVHFPEILKSQEGMIVMKLRNTKL